MQGLKLGTRGSSLALAQARKVAAAIETAQRWPEGYVEIVTVTTTGDKVQDRPLAELGGKALWTKELDRALLDGAVDFCVHSMKDVESIRPKEIHIAAVRPRGDVRDRLIGAESIDKLKDRKSTRLNSSHEWISYAVFCLKKKKKKKKKQNNNVIQNKRESTNKAT